MSKTTPRIKQAIEVATKAHEGQFRKTGEPYIIHPLAVMKILEEWNMDEDTIIAGILHDTVEDTPLTLKEIEEHFGKDVAFLVNGVTKLSKARSGMKNLDEYLPETGDNLLKLLIATGQDIRVLIIKIADRLHNLRTLGALPPEKQALLDSYKERFYKQLKGDPDPIAPKGRDGEYTIYSRIDNFIRAILRKETSGDFCK